eukprot:2644875-Amphidinium_carterae.1
MAILTPDGDVYTEDIGPTQTDIIDVRACRFLGDVPVDVAGQHVHRFRGMPNAVVMNDACRRAALMCGILGG